MIQPLPDNQFVFHFPIFIGEEKSIVKVAGVFLVTFFVFCRPFRRLVISTQI